MIYALVVIGWVLVGLALWRIEELNWTLAPLAAQVRYEVKSQIASDAVAYAGQQAYAEEKRRRERELNFRWSGDQRKRCALDFAKIQCEAAGLAWTSDLLNQMTTLIDAHVAYDDERAERLVVKLPPR